MIGVYSLSPQCGNFQTSLQDRVFMGMGMFSCSWEMLFKVWLCESNFQSTCKQLSDVLWDHLEPCTHSVYILCSQPVQNQLTSKKSTVIFLNMLWISNVINSYGPGSAQCTTLMIPFSLFLLCDPFMPWTKRNVCVHVRWGDHDWHRLPKALRCWK